MGSNTPRLNGERKELSLDRFFNCYDLSDCTLEIVEEELTEKSEEKCSIRSPVREDVIKTGSMRRELGKRSREIEPSIGKKSKVDKALFQNEACESKNAQNGKMVLFIHSLLFCSNSEFFQEILMSESRQQHQRRNLKVILQPGEAEIFIKLIKLFYDDRLIDDLTVVETAQVLKYAKEYKCTNVITKLLHHISSFKISSVTVLNQAMNIYNELIETNNTNMTDVIAQLKASCQKFLKEHLCPLEKVFGPLLYDFLKLSFVSVYFFLDSIDSGISVTEDTVVGLIYYWLEYNSVVNKCHETDMAIKLFKRCRLEHVNILFIMDVLCPPQPCWMADNYHEFYMHLLEYHASTDKYSYFPDFPKRALRCRNFAYDHENFLFFAPLQPQALPSITRTSEKNEEDDNREMMLHTADHNVIFVRGYQIHISSGGFQAGDNRELRVKLSVENLNRMPHSPLMFSMLYAIASPSVSEQFSPWSHCSFLIDPYSKSAWAVLSLIAKHSLINETGFYLKFYLE